MGTDYDALCAQRPDHHETLRVNTYEDVVQVVRSNKVISPAEAFAGIHREWDDNGAINVREFVGDTLEFVDREQHRDRRRLLNNLVRPAGLVELRDVVLLPAAERHMERMLVPRDDGAWECDLARLLEAIFLEFAARLIGFVDVESEDAGRRLREYVLPLFAAVTSPYFEDRDAVNRVGLETKEKYVKEFYAPARSAMLERLDRVRRGELSEEDVPHNLMRILCSHQHSDYEDEALAIRESMLIFITSVGTSTQGLVNTVQNLSDWFIAHPEDEERRTDREFLCAAMQESLRLWGPGNPYQPRVAVEDVELGSLCVKKNQELHIEYPGASRDPAVFGENAGEFDPWREVPPGVNRYGLAFGHGIHQCFGLRMVLGADGRGGAHLDLLKMFYECGIEPDPTREPDLMGRMPGDVTGIDLPNYASYPVVFRHWRPDRTRPRDGTPWGDQAVVGRDLGARRHESEGNLGDGSS